MPARTKKPANNDLSDLQKLIKSAVEAAVEGMLNDLPLTAARASFNIQEFCKRHNISPMQFFRLRKQGRGPRVLQAGRQALRISLEAEQDWIRERERDQRETPFKGLKHHKGEHAAKIAAE